MLASFIVLVYDHGMLRYLESAAVLLIYVFNLTAITFSDEVRGVADFYSWVRNEIQYDRLSEYGSSSGLAQLGSSS